MTTLKELQAEVERLWTIELEARRAAAAAEERWRAALREHYDETQLEVVGLRRCEE
jgi:hypothetical protein